MNNTAICVRDLTKKFASNVALKNINFDVEQGEFILILGPNGAGKTTLLKILETLIKPTSGTVKINQKNISESQSDIKKIIGVISHDSYLYDYLTVEENLVFFSKLYGLDPESTDLRIKELLLQMDLKSKYQDTVKNLSRGMKQRLAIIRAIIHSPHIIFMDEPYTGLDINSTHKMKSLLLESCKNSTIIMVSHEIDAAFDMCSRIIIMLKGKIRADIYKKDIDSIQHLKTMYAQMVME